MTRDERIAKYGEGPWADEPDHVAFEHASLPCLLHRNRLGAWCGYVGIPEGHPWFGQGYDDVHKEDGERPDVHGGLTYAEPCQGPICHDAPDRRWWLGFDCNHAQDIAPGLEQSLQRAKEMYEGLFAHVKPRAREFFGEPVTYKDLAYVREQTENLARQAAEAGKP